MAEWLLLAGIGVLVLCLLVTLLALLLLSGLFASFEIKTGKPPLGEAVIAYRAHRGPYKECGPMFTQVCGMVPQGYKTLGIYYDDPNVVEAHKLRYIVGVILSEDGSEIDMATQEKLTQNGYQIAKLPAASYAVNTVFPYRSALSILIAVWRVYPRMNDYVKERKLCAHPYLEVYEGDSMYFIAPLARQNEFYVPEVREAEERAEEGDDEDDSSLDESVSASRETTFSRSVMGDDIPISDSEDEEEEERETTYPTPDTCQSQELLRGEFTPRKLLEDGPRDECTPDVSEPRTDVSEPRTDVSKPRTIQDSEISSKQTSSSQIPEEPPKEEKSEKASNDSDSSFEEIMMENVPLPQTSS